MSFKKVILYPNDDKSRTPLILLRDEKGDMVCATDPEHVDLLQAAPDMLEALDEVRVYLEGHDRKIWEKVKAVIAKAKGEKS